MKITLIGFLIVIMAFCAGCGSESNPEAEAAAIDAAKEWLSLVDGERYSESWEEAAQLFKNAVPEEQWIRTMRALRKPFGGNISRKLKSTKYITSLPGAPDGEYVMIQFKSSFANKQNAIETITPMMDVDGKWRVSGYYMNQ